MVGPDSDESEVQDRVSGNFGLGKCEVTQRKWEVSRIAEEVVGHDRNCPWEEGQHVRDPARATHKRGPGVRSVHKMRPLY